MEKNEIDNIILEIQKVDLTPSNYARFRETYESAITHINAHIEKLTIDYKEVKTQRNILKEDKKYKKIIDEYPEYYPMKIKEKEDAMHTIALAINTQWNMLSRIVIPALTKLSVAFDISLQIKESNALVESTQKMIMNTFNIAEVQLQKQMEFNQQMIYKYIAPLTAALENNNKIIDIIARESIKGFIKADIIKPSQEDNNWRDIESKLDKPTDAPPIDNVNDSEKMPPPPTSEESEEEIEGEVEKGVEKENLFEPGNIVEIKK